MPGTNVALRRTNLPCGCGFATSRTDVLASIIRVSNRAIEGEFPYLYLDGVILKRSWAGEIRNVSVLVASGIATDGFRHILGVALTDRGLSGMRLIISDACRGLAEAAGEILNADWQRCVMHYDRDVFSHMPTTKIR